MTFGTLIRKSIAGGKSNFGKVNGGLRGYSIGVCTIKSFLLPSVSPRSGFSFLSTTEGIILYGKREFTFHVWLGLYIRNRWLLQGVRQGQKAGRHHARRCVASSVCPIIAALRFAHLVPLGYPL